MFQYLYWVQCYLRPHDYRCVQTYWECVCKADEVENTIKHILEEAQKEMRPEDNISRFTITRMLISEHFHWNDKVLFDWKNPELRFS